MYESSRHLYLRSLATVQCSRPSKQFDLEDVMVFTSLPIATMGGRECWPSRLNEVLSRCSSSPVTDYSVHCDRHEIRPCRQRAGNATKSSVLPRYYHQCCTRSDSARCYHCYNYNLNFKERLLIQNQMCKQLYQLY